MEHLPRRVYEEISLRAKLYTVRFHDDKDEQKSKGIMARVRPKHEEYRAAMETGLEAPVAFSQLQSRNFVMAIINFKKKALSPLNDKVFQIRALENRPLGHWAQPRDPREGRQALRRPGPGLQQNHDLPHRACGC